MDSMSYTAAQGAGPSGPRTIEENETSKVSGHAMQPTDAPSRAASRTDRLLRERSRKMKHSASMSILQGSTDPVPPARAERQSSKVTSPPGPPPAKPHVNTVRHKLTIVSNRLPVSAVRNHDHTWSLTVSSGGLVSALLGVSQHDTRWVGWPGQYVPGTAEKDTLTAELLDQRCIPVWMDKKTLDLHYNGFCNSVLWQLFHYVPVQMDFKLSDTQNLQQQWAAYQHANRMFADVMLSEHREGDIVWVQDYHLMLLPEMLKQSHPEIKVGFFLHTPFPSSEIYRMLPYREEVLRAVLKADLIGFHTYDYVRHFISSCTRILGLEGTPYGVEENGVLTRVAAFPIGIDPDRFARALQESTVVNHIKSLQSRYQDRQVMLGVDRLDMIKGIPQKLLAFEKFLDEHPEWHEKVLLVQIAVPSRMDVPEYQHLRSTVHEIVGRINGKYGTLTHVPIHHLDRSLSFHELCALYAVTDIALVTSLRDGMNLVSYEYVACQRDKTGVLVLSEFAGAAQSLGAGSILVNPWNISDMAQAIEEALLMTKSERYDRWLSNFMHITIHTAQTWADNFISELNDTYVEAALRTSHQPPHLPMPKLTNAFRKSSKRLILLGYNVTLTPSLDPPKRKYDALKKDVMKVVDSILESIKALAQDPNNVIVISSGSQKHKLIEAFSDVDVWLAAENGVYLRPPPSMHDRIHVEDGDGWLCLYENMNSSWVGSVQLVFDYFCERTPRSFVETRDTSVVWNYKYADVDFGRIQAHDMLQHLLTGPISNSAVDIVRGSRSVEVRMVGVNKGVSTARLIETMARLLGVPAVSFDFVLCAGHFMSRDETVFSYFEGKNVTDFNPRGATRNDLRRPNEELMSNLKPMSPPFSFATSSPDIHPGFSPYTPHKLSPSASIVPTHHHHSSQCPSPMASNGHPRPDAKPRPSETTFACRQAEPMGTLPGALSAIPSVVPLMVNSCQPDSCLPELRITWAKDESTLKTTRSLDGRLTDQKHRHVLLQRDAQPSTSDLDSPTTPSAQTTQLQQELFPPKHLFTVTVARSQSCARNSVGGSTDVGRMLHALTKSTADARRRSNGSFEDSKRTSLDHVRNSIGERRYRNDDVAFRDGGIVETAASHSFLDRWVSNGTSTLQTMPTLSHRHSMGRRPDLGRKSRDFPFE